MASKSKRRRKVLGASCILAALIIAGSSFAWFTSKDEVVNRLSANAEYEMAIAETFQPPKSWVPGQTIGKDVAVTNTGNVDAFTRVWLTGSMKLLNQTKANAESNAKYSTDVAGLTDVNDADLLSMGITRYDATNKIYFKTLNKKQTLNPNEQTGTDKNGFAGAIGGPYSEVQAMQSGVLAYAPDNAEYSYVLKEETKLTIAFKDGGGSGTIGYKEVTVPVGTLVKVVASDPDNDKGAVINATTGALTLNDTVAANSLTSASGSKNAAAYNVAYVKADATFGKPKDIEFESFIPETDGVYLFLRTEYKYDSTNPPEFSGYKVSNTETNNASGATFYALNTNTEGNNRSDNTVKGNVDAAATHHNPVRVDTGNDGVINQVSLSDYLELFNAKYTTVDSANLKWVYNGTAGSEKMYAFYNATAADTKFDTASDIAIEIALDNVGTANAQQWSALGAGTTNQNYVIDSTTDNAFSGVEGSKVTFYYNDDVESGDSTAILIDSVKLIDQVTNKAYLAFDFDLKVNMDSVQVTFDEAGNEKVDAAQAEFVGGNAPTKIKVYTSDSDNGVTDSGTAPEAGKLTWTAATT